MNIFGTFAYGNIIKTFIPGILIVFGLALLVDGISYWNDMSYTIMEYSAGHPILTLGLIIPLSVFAGILSNSFCFTWLIPKFIEQQYNLENKDFISYRESFTNEMKGHYANILGIPHAYKDAFKQYTDIDSFLLIRKELTALQYLRESYWYYLEFQVNSILAILLLSLAGLIHILLRYNADEMQANAVLPYIMSIVLTCAFVTYLFWCSAKKNYDKHQKNPSVICWGLTMYVGMVNRWCKQPSAVGF